MGRRLALPSRSRAVAALVVGAVSYHRRHTSPFDTGANVNCIVASSKMYAERAAGCTLGRECAAGVTVGDVAISDVAISVDG